MTGSEVGGFQILPVMVQKIGNSVQCKEVLPLPGCPLDHHDLILGISVNGILLLLDGADNVLKS